MAFPTGTLTFFFTDIEGSSTLWERDEPRMRASLAVHDGIFREAITRNAGEIFKSMGDAYYAVFVSVDQAIAAALEAQRRLQEERDDDSRSRLKVRIALYTGFAQAMEGDYSGPPLNRAARLLSVAHGEQILLSEATRDLATSAIPAGIVFKDLGDHSLRGLERSERVFQLCHPDLRGSFPPLRSLSAYKHNMPIQLTALIGREAEIERVRMLVENHRLVTLYGSGGCGKTRLALQAGAELLDQFPDGVWFIELSGAPDSDHAYHAIGAALGIREEGLRPIEELAVQHLKDKTALLILDNCEHLVEFCAKEAHTLLRSCPGIKVLSTSREVLGVGGEVTWRVPSLGIPPVIEKPSKDDLDTILRSDSVRLFVERAMEGAPGFSVDHKHAATLAWIAWRLDGIPLALELAAARVKSLSVDQLAERLKEHFSILVGPRTALPRHKTILATMDWSYLLLEDAERALLDRLSVFVNGWTLDGAEAVCAAPPIEREHVLDLLSRLEDKSLIIVDSLKEPARYHMLQMVREYTASHLTPGEANELGARHLEHFSGLAMVAEEQLAGTAQMDWLRRLDTEYENLRGALEFSRESAESTEAGLLLAGAMARYWHIRGYLSEGRRQLTAMIGTAEPDRATPGLALALNGLGTIVWTQGDLDSARDDYSQSLRIWRELGNERRIAGVLSNLGLVSIDAKDLEGARRQLQESLEIRRKIKDRAGEALSLMNLGIVARYEGDYTAAEDQYRQCLEIFRAMGNADGEAMALNNLGDIHHEAGDLEAACAMHEKGLTLFEQIGDKRGMGYTLLNLGEVAMRQKSIDSAKMRYSSALELAIDLGSRDLIIRTLYGISRVALATDQAAGAAHIAGAIASMRKASPESTQLTYDQISGPLEEDARGKLGDERYRAECREGELLSIDEIARFAQDVCLRQIDLAT